MQIQKPRNYQEQGNTWSSYKQDNVVNILIGVRPDGGMGFCSKPFEGNISDRKLLIDSGLLELLEPGDYILAGEIVDRHTSYIYRGKASHSPEICTSREEYFAMYWDFIPEQI